MGDVGGLATTEILRHPPGLIWAIVCAILLCGGTGMLATRKRVKKQTGMRIFPVLEIQEHALFVVEEILYFYMGIVNIVLGIIFWVLDFFYEGMPLRNANYFPVVNPLTKTQEPDLVPPKDSSSPLSADQDVILRPRRAGIFRSRKGTRESCGCWGYQVDDIPAPSATTNMGEREDNSCPNGIAESKGKNNGEEVDHPRPRWSECQCPECTMLMMPMRLAAKNLFVRCPDSPTGESRCTDSQGQEIPVDSNLSALALHLGDSKLIPKLSSDLPSVPQISDNLDIKNQSAVIFIHGLFSSSLFWFDTKLVPNLSKEIKEQHHVLVPDILGCGKSPRPVDSLYSLSDQIEALEESLIKRHGLESFHLVGHSMGCIFALVLAARCPERVRSITLIAPVYTPGALAADGKLAQLPCEAVFTFVKPFSVKGIRALLISKYYNVSRFAGIFFYSRHKYWVDLFHRRLKRYPISFIADYLTVYHDAAWHTIHNSLLAGSHTIVPSLTKLQKYGQRILVIHGVDDTSCKFTLSQEMSETFSIVDLHAVPGQGHVDVLWKRDREALDLIEAEIHSGDAKFGSTRVQDSNKKI